MNNIEIKAIELEVGRKTLRLSISDAEKLYNELHQLFGSRSYPYFPYYPIYIRSTTGIPVSDTYTVTCNTSSVLT